MNALHAPATQERPQTDQAPTPAAVAQRALPGAPQAIGAPPRRPVPVPLMQIESTRAAHLWATLARAGVHLPSRSEPATPDRLHRVMRSGGFNSRDMLASLRASAEGHIFAIELEDRQARGQITGGPEEARRCPLWVAVAELLLQARE